MIDWSRWPNFAEHEFACRCCGKAEMDPAFMYWLQEVRTACGFPFPITSGYRCPEHNARVNGGPAHLAGQAADIAVRGEHAMILMREALIRNVAGLGVNQRGGGGRFIHLDRYTGAHASRPASWSY